MNEVYKVISFGVLIKKLRLKEALFAFRTSSSVLLGARSNMTSPDEIGKLCPGRPVTFDPRPPTQRSVRSISTFGPEKEAVVYQVH